MSEPVTVDEEGPKIRPELMETEKLYHCIYKNCVLLFFLDDQKFLCCYEVDEPDIVKKIQNCDGSIEDILAQYGGL